MKFTIREVLMATALAALCAGWWADRSLLWRSIKASHDRGVSLAREYGALTGAGLPIPAMPGEQVRFDD